MADPLGLGGLFIGGAVPALILGVAVGNTLRGVPFHFTSDLRPIYEGNLFGLLNPVALYCGLVSVSMLVMHGAAWIALKSEGLVAARAKEFGVKAAIASSILFAGGGLLVWLGLLGGYRVTSPVVWGGPSNPLLKTVIADPAAWFTNFDAHPSLWIVPAFGVAAPLAAALGFRVGREVLTFFASSLVSRRSSPQSGSRCSRFYCHRAAIRTTRSPSSMPRPAAPHCSTCWFRQYSSCRLFSLIRPRSTVFYAGKRPQKALRRPALRPIEWRKRPCGILPGSWALDWRLRSVF